MAKLRTKLMPKGLRHIETKYMIEAVLDELEEQKRLSAICAPFLHRLASSYERYLDAFEYLSTHSAIDVNKKGEEVKHPNVNIEREAYSQFLAIAKEFGFTIKSSMQIKSHKGGDGDKEYDAPITKWGKK
jgi:P27 family predicted phage terminase small subunit